MPTNGSTDPSPAPKLHLVTPGTHVGSAPLDLSSSINSSGDLARWAESSVRSAAFDLNGRTRPLVFNEAVHKRVVRRLGYSVEQGTPLYLQGAVVGVGASVLVREFARQFTETHRNRGVPDRVVVVRLHRGIRSARDLLSVFALALQVKFTQWELRMGDKTTIGEVLAAEVRRCRVRAVVFDHVARAGLEGQALIAEFMLAMNPLYARFFEEDPEPSKPTAVILVDEYAPEETFKHIPDVLTTLGGSYVELGRYQTVEHVADALRDSAIGLADLDLGVSADLEMTERVLELTDGLIANMDPLLGLIDYTARSCCERPSLKHVMGALRYHRKMVTVALGTDSDGKEALELVAKRRRRIKRPSEGADEDLGGASSGEKKKKPSRTAKKAKNLKLAEQEKSDLQRQRDYTVLPGG